MELDSSINRQLDSIIQNKINILQKDTNLNITKIDQDIREFWTKINLFDASTNKSELADKYFNEWSLKLNLDKNFFITTNSLDMKPEIIVAIKTNELKLLNELLQRKY